MKPGSAIINTASINSDTPNPTLLAYATTKGAIQNFTAGLAQLLARKGIRANAVAPGPIWTPLIPSTMSEDAVANFGKQVPMERPGQPAELATAFVMLAIRCRVMFPGHHCRHGWKANFMNGDEGHEENKGGEVAGDQPHKVVADSKLSPVKKEKILDTMEQDARLLHRHSRRYDRG